MAQPSESDLGNPSNPSSPVGKGPLALFGLLADINLSTYVFIFVSVYACFSAVSFTADLFCQFRLQIAAGLAFIILVQLLATKFKKVSKPLMAAALSLVLNVVCVVVSCVAWPGANRNTDHRAGTASSSAVPSGHTLKMLQFNLNNNNRRYAQFVSYVLKLKPDVICLEEYSPGWSNNIAAVKKEYPYEVSKIQADSFGVAIFSRYPLQHQAIVAIGKTGEPSAFAQIDIDGQFWSFLVSHPLPPMNRQWYNLRNEQFMAIADFVKNKGSDHFVLSADLNCVPWSAHFINLLSASGLQDTRAGFGVQPSWPVNCWILRIPIDHVLTSKNIDTKVRRIEPDLGSDHLPIYVELADR